MTTAAVGAGPVRVVLTRARAGFLDLGRGLGTALTAALLTAWLIVVLALLPVGAGVLLAPSAVREVRRLAEVERARTGSPTLGPGPDRLRAAVTDRLWRRDLRWVLPHATAGLALGLLGTLLPVYAVRDLSFPLWWWLVPAGADASPWWWTVRTWPDALAVAGLGAGWALLSLAGLPVLARAQSGLSRALLHPPADVDLSLRVAELTATRAAALDAHAAELRRIERSLHDGTQNRLVGVNVLLGAARRALARNPAGVDDLLARAQTAIEEALADLRAVVRSVLPPVLERGLAAAVTGLAADCPVPCRVEVAVEPRCPASVEATAYFVVAEALTNVSRHARARAASVSLHRRAGVLHVAVDDDGRGGAEPGAGTGLAGVRRRVEALDGTLEVTSPPGGPTRVEVRLPCGS
ncbi:sensor histidine kinase [Kineococcus sp. LSe6-4]|uniref:Oxygen sensor histidine kinase NreB n=1 Tax=Kineococcus halophytocola TaxID=3234027 RepID=A0ABV4H689_9ACTN